MNTIVMKIKQTNYLALVMVIVITLWQGYELQQGKNMYVNFDTYLYTKIISNVIPATAVAKSKQETNLFNKIIYGLTEIDLTDYRTIIENAIPLAKYNLTFEPNEDYNTLVGANKFKVTQRFEVSEDYFDPSQELLITKNENLIDYGKKITKEQLQDETYVLSKLINFDANLNFENQAMKQLNIIDFVERQFKINTQTSGPKVLIFHTHHHERFAGEEPSDGGVVDVGRYLKEILEKEYGVETLHCTSRFEGTGDDKKKDDYGRMQIEIKQIIQENPSIEVAIDIHRDAIDGEAKFITNINGKQTAKLMFVNGFCQVQKQGVLTPIERLPNPYVEDNMALALQMQLKAIEKYPGFIRKTLVKPYRYSLHMRPMSLLIEIGNQNNTKEEALNTMEVFAELLMDVIEKD